MFPLEMFGVTHKKNLQQMQRVRFHFDVVGFSQAVQLVACHLYLHSNFRSLGVADLNCIYCTGCVTFDLCKTWTHHFQCGRFTAAMCLPLLWEKCHHGNMIKLSRAKCQFRLRDMVKKKTHWDNFDWNCDVWYDYWDF